METAETRAKLAGAIRQLQASGDTATIDRLVSAYKTKYKSPTADAPFTVPVTPEDRAAKIANYQAEADQANAEAKKANSVLGFAGNFGKALVSNLAGSEVGLGKTIAKTFGNQSDTYSKTLETLQGSQASILKQIRDKEARGEDTLKLKKIYNDNLKQIDGAKAGLAEESNLPTTGQVAGQLGGVALDLATAGTYGKAATAGMEAGKLATTAAPIATTAARTVLPEVTKVGEVAAKSSGLFTKAGIANVVKGAGIGYGYDVTQGLQGARGEDRTAGKAFIPGLGTAIGGGIPAITGGVQSVKDITSGKAKQDAINELESKYTEWSTGTKPGKKLVNGVIKKTEMLDKAGTTGKTPMRTLAENGVVPEIKGTKFDTYIQAESFRNNVNSLQEANRSALAEAGLSTIPSDLNTLEAKAIKYAKTPQNINGGRFDKMEKEIRAEFDLLRKNYPDGKIPLALQDDIKSARWDNVFKNKGLVDADVLKKDSEYAIAKALQKNIEEVATQAGHSEVAQLNREIGDRLEAAKFLESLDGKVLKGGRLGKFVGTVIGSSLGQTIPGKIIGALGGNYVADILIKSSVQSPVRRAILKNLETKDPAAYEMTIKWLAEQDSLRGARLALPAGQTQPIVNSGRPIISFPKNVEGQYVGKEVATQLKSPNAQQTMTATKSVANIPTSIPLPGSVEQIQESALGFVPGTRKLFDRALTDGNKAEIQRLLPQIPEAYRMKFAREINDILTK
jgi:hypothetical protein